MGTKGLKVLRDIKEQKGFIITNGQSAAMMTDILDIDRFHIGKVKRVLTEKIMGIPMHSGFVQFVPAGVRTSLAYPTPVQTSKDFEQALKSKSFKKLSDKIGQEKLYKLLREDAQENGETGRLRSGGNQRCDRRRRTFVDIGGPEMIGHGRNLETKADDDQGGSERPLGDHRVRRCR